MGISSSSQKASDERIARLSVHSAQQEATRKILVLQLKDAQNETTRLQQQMKQREVSVDHTAVPDTHSVMDARTIPFRTYTRQLICHKGFPCAGVLYVLGPDASPL